MGNYIEKLILEGEHENQDFKFAVNDSKKIARSLSAFSNTSGGKLLIGVKDNGAIAGVRSEEEFYMIEAAAHLYCKPKVPFKTREHTVDGKVVLEIEIPESRNKPHKAPAKDGRYMAFVRVGDENVLARSIYMKVWKKEKRKKGILLSYSREEKAVLNFLGKKTETTLSSICKATGINRYRAENILSDLIVFNSVVTEFKDEILYFRINKEERVEPGEKQI